jgi:hypothetical protein
MGLQRAIWERFLLIPHSSVNPFFGFLPPPHESRNPDDPRGKQQERGRLGNRSTSGVANNTEGLRWNRSDGVLRSLRGAARRVVSFTAVLIPVHRIAGVDQRVLEVDPIRAGIQVRAVEAAALLADIEAVGVGEALRRGKGDVLNRNRGCRRILRMGLKLLPRAKRRREKSTR